MSSVPLTTRRLRAIVIYPGSSSVLTKRLTFAWVAIFRRADVEMYCGDPDSAGGLASVRITAKCVALLLFSRLSEAMQLLHGVQSDR